MSIGRIIRLRVVSARLREALLAGVCVVAMAPAAALGQCDEAKLLPFGGAAGDRFGAQVAADYDVAIVGAPLNQDAGVEAGAAYIYRFVEAVDGWVEEAQLLPPPDVTTQFFGASVDICGDLAIVGSGEFTDVWTVSADVYRFDGEGWFHEAHLPAAPYYVGSVFSAKWVSICDDTAVVGVWADDSMGEAAGAAYVYSYSYEEETWVFVDKLKASDGEAGDYFGISVDLSDDVMIIGAYRDDDVAKNAGAAYIFRGESGGEAGSPEAWWEEAKLTASEGEAGDKFGISVAVEYGIAVVGAYRADDLGKNSGAAVVYGHDYGPGDASYWWEMMRFTAYDGDPGDEFGCSVDLSEYMVVIGASREDDNGSDAGAAYLYGLGGESSYRYKVTAPDGGAGDRFGYSVAVDYDISLVGSRFDDDGGEDSGSAHVFDVDESDCNENGWCDWVDILEGTSQDCNENGEPDECDIDYGWSEDCQPNGIPDECELDGNDCNWNQIPDDCDIAFGTSEDCQPNGIPDECELDGNDCNQNGIPDECELSDNDCNQNGVPDECDVWGGYSEDCNENGVPDECDIADETSGDCNANGVPDECDIADGTSHDDNQNGVPDECECLADVNEDELVDVVDLLAVLAAWGQTGSDLPEDVNYDGIVDVLDILIVLAAWGPCPQFG